MSVTGRSTWLCSEAHAEPNARRARRRFKWLRALCRRSPTTGGKGNSPVLVAIGARPGNLAIKLFDFDDTRNRAYQEAGDSAFTGAGQEQSRLFGLNSGARQQLFGEATQQGNFANAAQQNAYQQSLQNANLGNQTRQQGLQEAFYLRDRPLQEFQTLRGAIAAPQLPQAASVQGSQVAPGNAFQAFQARQGSQQPSPFGQLLGIGGQIAGNLIGGGK